MNKIIFGCKCYEKYKLGDMMEQGSGLFQVQKGFYEEVVIRLKLEGRVVVNREEEGKGVFCRRNDRCKGFEMGSSWVCLRTGGVQ